MDLVTLCWKIHSLAKRLLKLLTLKKQIDDLELHVQGRFSQLSNQIERMAERLEPRQGAAEDPPANLSVGLTMDQEMILRLADASDVDYFCLSPENFLNFMSPSGNFDCPPSFFVNGDRLKNELEMLITHGFLKSSKAQFKLTESGALKAQLLNLNLDPELRDLLKAMIRGMHAEWVDQMIRVQAQL